MLKPVRGYWGVMAAMEEVDAAAARTRMVFLGAAASSLAAAAFMLFGTLLTTSRSGVEVELSATKMLAEGGFGGVVLLAMSLALLWPAYLALMSSVGMWQARERLQAAGLLVTAILAAIMISSWKWISTAETNGDEWSIGCSLIGFTVASITTLGLWRAGLWLLDAPYRE